MRSRTRVRSTTRASLSSMPSFAWLNRCERGLLARGAARGARRPGGRNRCSGSRGGPDERVPRRGRADPRLDRRVPTSTGTSGARPPGAAREPPPRSRTAASSKLPGAIRVPQHAPAGLERGRAARKPLGDFLVIAEREIDLLLGVVVPRHAEERLLRPGALRVLEQQAVHELFEVLRLPQPTRDFGAVVERLGGEVAASDLREASERGRELTPAVARDPHSKLEELLVGHVRVSRQQARERLIGVTVTVLFEEDLGAPQPEVIKVRRPGVGDFRSQAREQAPRRGRSAVAGHLVVERLEGRYRAVVALQLGTEPARLRESISPADASPPSRHGLERGARLPRVAALREQLSEYAAALRSTIATSPYRDTSCSSAAMASSGRRSESSSAISKRAYPPSSVASSSGARKEATAASPWRFFACSSPDGE